MQATISLGTGRFVRLFSDWAECSRHLRSCQKDLTKFVPAEILCKILRLAKDSSVRPPHPFPKPPGVIDHGSLAEVYSQNIDLVKMTHVSSRWRSVAVTCGDLWGSVVLVASDTSTVKSAGLFFVRSKGSVLSVYVWDHGDPSALSKDARGLVMKLASESRRIVTCELFSQSSAFWDTWIYPAPIIHKLMIGGKGITNTGLFSAELGQLRRFSSSGPCGVLPPGGHRTLTFADINASGSVASLGALLNAFRECEALEQLLLTGFSSLKTGDIPVVTISPPSLRVFTLTFCDTTTILRHINVPPSIQVINISLRNPPEDLLSGLPENFRLARFLQGVERLTVHVRPRQGMFHLCADRSNSKFQLTIFIISSTGSLSLDWVSASLDEVVEFPPFSTTSSIHFSTDFYMRSWSPEFLRLPYLQYLDISCPTPESLVHALLHPVIDDGLLARQVLKTVAFHRCGPCVNPDCAALKRVVHSRRMGQNQLEEILLHRAVWGRMEASDPSWVDLLEPRGMVLLPNCQTSANLVPRSSRA